jgi:hypothetical protein
MKALAWIPLLCGCTAAVAPATPIGERSPGPKRASELDQLGFIAGCWQEELTRRVAADYRFCWVRERDRWHGSLTLQPRGPGAARVTHYFISDSAEGLVLQHDATGTTERVPASRAEHEAIEFRRPDQPGRSWRGPDLALHHYSPSDELRVKVFDVAYTFSRAR